MVTNHYSDETILSEKERSFVNAVHAFLKNNYSREECMLLVERAVYQHLLINRKLSPAQVCDTLGLSQPTVTRTIRDLGFTINKTYVSPQYRHNTEDYDKEYFQKVTKQKRELAMKERLKKKLAALEARHAEVEVVHHGSS